ncbi:MAG: DUF4129 domain-containing protein [Anaerosomatales bacterium]|nr:DUF4129 domain-containing protein [Anaerosomatales bacterium]MDI6842875.1 DUF4129 domain-containing protein [Anaerosomatales bacterium]
MRRWRASLLVAALIAALTVACSAHLAAAAPASSLDEAVRLLERSKPYDAASAERLADEVEPPLAATGDEQALDLVERLRQARSGSERARVRDDLAAHARSLAALERKAASSVRHDPALLSRIMAEEGVAGGSAAQEFLRKLQERLFSWLERLLSSVFGSRAASSGFEVAYYVALAVSALVAAWLIWRVLSAVRGKGGARRRRGAPAGSGAEPVVEAARDLPEDALAYADAEAAAGRLREAVRALFGGAARALVERGVVPVAKTRTTREILHDVAEHAPQAHPPFAELARVFEPAWYGHQDPRRDGYDRARQAYLETLAAASGGGAPR